MSVDIQTVKFEQSSPQAIEFSDENEDEPPFTVHGVALGADDVTVGQSGTKKLWPAEELRAAAKTLKGTNLVEDHNNGSRGVIGKVTSAGFKEGIGVIYEAELFDEDLADKIKNGLLEVSIRGHHIDVSEMDEDPDSGAKIVEGIRFDNLSIVPSGAAPSNTINMGEHDELSFAQLSQYIEELQEIEPGTWVKWGDNRGITISQIEDGEVEVDIYEKQDGQWRSTEETTMVSTDDLSEWDVDEEDVGPAEDDEEENAEIPDRFFFESEEDAMEFIEDKDGLTGVHEMDKGWMPGDDHEEFLEWWDNQSSQSGHEDDEEDEEEMASVDDKVQWDNGSAQGVIVDRKTDGCFSERIDGDQEICADDDDPVALIEIVQDGERTGTMVAHKESTLSSADFELSKHKMDPDMEDDKESESEPVDVPDFEEGMMVQWQVNPDMFGRIVHNPEDEEIVMVEVMEMMDGEMKPTGHTLTAAPPDLMPFDEDQMSDADELETFSDYPEAASENAQMALDAREETGNPNDCGTQVGWRRANQLSSGEAVSEDVVAKMSAFNRHRSNKDQGDEGRENCGWMMWKAWGGDEGVDWAMRKMEQIEEASRIEGEEESVTSDAEKEEIREQSPERFTPDEIDEVGEEAANQRKRTIDDTGEEPDVRDVGPAGIGLDLIEKYLRTPGHHERDSVDDMLGWLIGSPDKIPMETVGDFRTAANSFLTNTPGTDSFDGLTIEQFRDWLLTVQRGEPQRDMRGASMSDEELQETEVHEPDFSGTTESSWDKPALEDFGEEPDMSDVADHFIVSVTGFPPENFGDLALPVVEPNGNLNLNALQNAKARANQVDGLSGEDLDRAVSIINSLANEEFDADFEENASSDGDTIGAVNVLTGDDLRQRDKSEESEMDSINTIDTTTMTEDIEEQLAELDSPVAVEESDLEALREKADRFEEMSSTLEALKERTDVLDEVDREQVEELEESDEPVVIESARYEELTDEAEQVAGVYAAALAEAVEVFDAEELTDKFSIEELRSKYEEHIGEPEEELTSSDPEPRSGDVDEEELEEQAESEEEKDELSEDEEKAEEMRAELREKILGDD